MILAGDIGGTSTRLAFFQIRDGQLYSTALGKYPSQEHAGLDEIVRAFTTAHSLKVEQACFGIAAPIVAGKAYPTNLPWVVDSAQLARELGLPATWLINDLEANAHGIWTLAPEDFAVLNLGDRTVPGNAAIISAGTGLGEAGLFWDGKAHHPFASEGGHGDFAPRNELEVELFLYLHRRFGHVSYERVLSGPGLHNIYDFLSETGRGNESAEVREAMRHQDPPMVISQAALAGTCERCGMALDLFVAFYGAEAGNLALKLMSLRGVWIGGGIAPKIIERLRTPIFMEAFTAKGRFKPLLEKIHVSVILNDQTALRGSARCAALRGGLPLRDSQP